MSKLDVHQYNSKGGVQYSFIEYPDTKIYADSTGSKWINHLIFGDYVKILDDTLVDNRVKVTSRNSTGWVNKTMLRKERVLEVNFVDIGQGDGCHIVTPDDQHILIDAGKSDNMIRYLTWRFNLYGKKDPLPFPFKVVISHSDSDHYLGFSNIFKEKKIVIQEIYHNGLVERPGKNSLGTVENGYITGLVNDTQEMLGLLNNPENRKGEGSLYCKTLFSALNQNQNNVIFKSLSVQDQNLPGFGPQVTVHQKPFHIKVLAPIQERVNGKDGLKTINNLGKDKNGHSVILKLQYGHATIMLGGDVNEEFGEIIHKYYQSKGQLKDLQVDVAKACHHGSNHFDYDFVSSINSVSTVISSGDDEPYSHPRPDAIGAFGKCGYGKKPLIFSTELARSNKEITRKSCIELTKNFSEIEKLKVQLKAATTEEDRLKNQQKIQKLNKEINSFITKYGMINLRTDGEGMILAQKYEREAPSGKWDIHELMYSQQTGRFEVL